MKLFDEQVGRAAELVLADHGRIASMSGQNFVALWESGQLKDDLYCATGVCLAIREDLERLNKDRVSRGQSPLLVSIGIDAGATVIAPSGAALGPVVRFANELAMAARGFGVDLLLSERAHQPIKDDFIFAACSTGARATVYWVKGLYDEAGKPFTVRTPYSHFPPEALPAPQQNSITLSEPPVAEPTLVVEPTRLVEPTPVAQPSEPAETISFDTHHDMPLAIPSSSIDIGKILSMPASTPTASTSKPIPQYTAPKIAQTTFIDTAVLSQTSFEGHWFLRNGSETLGPLTADEIASKLATEEVLPSWLVSQDLNSKRWLAIGNTPELSHLCPKAA